MEKDITLRLKPFSCYSKTSKGVFFYTKHDFRIFVPKSMLERIVKLGWER